MADEQVMERASQKPEVTVKDALDNVRLAAQQLHGAIIAALGKQMGATSTDIEALARRAKDSAAMARSAARERYEAAEAEIRKRLSEAADKLDAAGRETTASVQKSGRELRDSLMQALAQARASAADISNAVAAKRSEIAARPKPTIAN